MNGLKAKTNSIWGPVLVICLTIVISSAVTATAAKLITGKQIKNSTITGADVKNSSLTGSDIKNSSLTGSDVKDSSLTGSDVKDGSLAGSDVTDGSLTGSDVTDGSIGAGDLASGVIPPTPPPDSIKTVTDTTARTIPNSLTFSDVPGMGLTYTVPAGATSLLVTYSAECSVTSTFAAQYLSVQILVDGTEANPAEGGNTQFCTTDSTAADADVNQAVSASLQRVAAVSPGAHTVQVQATTVLIGTGTLDGQILTVQAGS